MLSRFNSVLNHLLSGRGATFLCLLIALAARMLLQAHYYDYNGDRAYQVVATHSLLTGHGLTIPQVSAQNLLEVQYRPLVGWPPGFSLLLAAVARVFHNDYRTAALLLDLFFVGLFVLSSRRIMRGLGLSATQLNLYTLLLGFYLYDFAAASTTDIYTLALFLSAVGLTLSLARRPGSVARYVLLGLLLFLNPFVRYMYAPLVLVPPLFLLQRGLSLKDRRTIRGSLVSLSVLLVLLAGLFVFQRQYTGAATYVIPSVTGFFPENLLRTDAFLLTGFVDLMVICIRFQNWFGWDYVSQVDVIRWLHLLPYAAFLAGTGYFLWTRRRLRGTARQLYLYLALACSLALIGLLSALSLRNAAIRSATYPLWTFVEEPRYFAYVVVFVQQFAFLYFFVRRHKRASAAFRAGRLVVAALLLAGSLHGLSYVSKLVTGGTPLTLHTRSRALEKQVFSLLQAQAAESGKDRVIVLSNDASYANLAGLEGYKGLYDITVLRQPDSLRAPAPVTLVVVLRDVLRKPYASFIAHPHTRFVGSFASHYFYTFDVAPSVGP